MKNTLIKCACGCKIEFYKYDKWNRARKYISGHNGRKYKNSTQRKREWNHRNRRQRYLYKQQWLRKFKGELIEKYGGKCHKCEYTYNEKNASAFDFHHKPEFIKEFNLNQSSLNRISKKSIYKEAEKCELLCAICHRLHHSSEY